MSQLERLAEGERFELSMQLCRLVLSAPAGIKCGCPKVSRPGATKKCTKSKSFPALEPPPTPLMNGRQAHSMANLPARCSFQHHRCTLAPQDWRHERQLQQNSLTRMLLTCSPGLRARRLRISRFRSYRSEIRQSVCTPQASLG